jgi:hypothetical protein
MNEGKRMAGPHLNVRIQVRGTSLSTAEARTKTVYNLYDFRRASGSAVPTKTQIEAAFKTAILTPLAACLSVSYVKGFVDVRFLDDPLDPYQTFVDGVNGTTTLDSLPSVNNVCMQMKTGVRYYNRGSKHFGPIAESDTLLDYLTSAALTKWATFQTAYLAGFTDGAGVLWTPVIVSAKYSIFTDLIATIVQNAVTSTIVNPYLGIMRKRSQERVNTM